MALPQSAGDPARSPRRRSSFSRFCRWTAKLVLAGILLLLLLATISWFSRDWLVKKAETALVSKLDERGVFVSYDQVEWQVLRGLVLTGITLWEDSQRSMPLVKLGDVAFRPGMTQLLVDRALTGRLSVTGAALNLYSEGESVANIENLKVHANLKRNGLDVSQLDGAMFGMEFQSEGYVLIAKNEDGEGADKDSDGGEDSDDEDGKKKIDFAAIAAIAEWAAFESKGKRPRLNVNFNIDRTADDPIVIEVELKGDEITWRGVPFDSVDVAAKYSDAEKSLDISRLKLGHRGGELEGAVHYGLKSRTVEIGSLRSTLNPFALVDDLPFDVGDRLDMVTLEDEHPEIQLAGIIELANFGQSVFKAEIPKPIALTLNLEEGESVPLQNVHGTVAFDKGNIGANDLAVTLYGLDVNANGLVKLAPKSEEPGEPGDPGEAGEAVDEDPISTDPKVEPDLNPEPEINPDSVEGDAVEPEGEKKKSLKPLLASIFGSIQKWTSFTSDSDNPQLNAKFAVDGKAADPVVVEGKLTGRNFTWQGAAIDSMDADVLYSQRKKLVAVPAFKFGYRGKSLHGGLDYGVGTKVLELYGVECQADWISLCNELPFGIEKHLQAVALPDPPELVANGKIAIGDYSASDFTLASVRPVPMAIKLGERLVKIDSVSGTVRGYQGKYFSDDLKLQIGGGDLSWQGEFLPATKGYNGSLKVDKLPLSELLKLAGKDPMKGTINGQLNGSGDKDVFMREGSGDILLTDTEALKIPIIGGLLKFLATVVPLGTGKDELVTMSFVTEDGLMKTDDLKASGAGVKVDVEGEVDWKAMSTQFLAEAKLSGAAGVITVLASKALKIEGSGPFNDVQWKFRSVDRIGDAAEGVIGAGGDAVMKVGEGAGEGVKIIGDGAEEGVKIITEGLMKLIPKGMKKKEPGPVEESKPPVPVPAPNEPANE